MSVYDGTTKVIGCNEKVGKPFTVKVGIRQGSCSSPLLFITVMDAVKDSVQNEPPCNLLYADDLFLSETPEVEIQHTVNSWQEKLEM
jgi:hypothetical protein